MKNAMKRLLSMLLVLALVGSMLPAAFAQEEAEPIVLTDEDYASADAVFAQIAKMEDAPAKKGASETELADAAAALVMESDSYVEGSLERNGNSFTWFTTEGVRCIYNPYMREKYENMTAPENPEPSGIYNEPKVTRGGWPSSNQVYLIAPYYGIDDSFTDQYKNEAKNIASAIGDTDGYTLYSGTAVTVDNVATAISNGAVVIFDSHGTTDYEGAYVCNDPDGYEVYDYVSEANYSYLCLTNKSGLTTEDYNDGATYFTDSEGVMCACINGAAIANHMTKNSPSGLLWMAICLGMATDTFATPLRQMGVEVVYGYSQSVTFAGDYCFEETFWDNMTAGKTVAQSVSAMKSKWGDWDWSEPIASSYGYSGSGYTLSEARKYRSAFPIVVSDEDTHPGQRTSGDSSYGADSQQTVKSTYTLFSQYNVTAQSNNTAYGTVSANGSTITATPATGYFAQSATVLSGTATVSQNGNTFQVSASSDCVVQINFAPKTPVTVSFSGATVNSQNGYAGDEMELPTAEAPEGFAFEGWLSAPLSADTTEKPAFYTDSFTPTGNTTLYALYSYVDESTTSGTGDYVKVTETPDDWSGEYLIVYEDGNLAFNGSLTSLATANTASITVNNGVISADKGDPYRFIIAPMNGGYSIQSASGKYISGTSGSNTVNAGDTAAANTIHIDAAGNADIVSNTSHLRYNSSAQIFRYYKAASYSSMQAISLYVKDGAKGTTYYTTNPEKCEHTNTTDVAAVEATCTEGGYTAGVQCDDCDVFISGHEPVAALGHSWSDWTKTSAPTCTEAGEQTRTCDRCKITETQAITATGHSYSNVVTPPTATEQGYTTYTCAICGHSYVGDYVEALGQTYTVSFSVPAGVDAIADMTCGNAGITLPEAAAPEGYTFVGWTTALTDDTETKPETYEAGNILTTNANVTLFALYSYTVGGGDTGNGDYVKVTTAPADWSGEYLIVYETTGYIFDGSLSAFDAVSNYKPVTITNNTISAAQGDPYKFTVAPMDGGYSFQGTSNYYFGHASDANKITSSTSAMLNTISLDADGNANIICEGGAYLRFNNQSGQTRFRYYKSTSYSNQQPIALYVKSGSSGTTYYTTIGTAQQNAAAVYSGDLMQKAYESLEDAVANCGANQYVKLLADVEAELILEADLRIDLNGHALTGIVEPDGHMVCCYDSTKEATGTFNCTDLNDAVVVPATIMTITTNDVVDRYMAIADTDGYSFHYFNIELTHISLRPANTALGYKAVFTGDDKVIAMLNQQEAFGFTLSLDGGNTITRWLPASKLVSGQPVTLRLKNVDVNNYGETNLSAYVSIQIGNTPISTEAQTTNFRSVVELVNDNYQTFTETQLASVKEMILANAVMQSWNVANILQEEPEGNEMAAIVESIYALAKNENMENVTLTGTITEIYTPYNATYNNITVIISVAGAEDMPVKCYRLTGDGAASLAVGDVITVTGTVTHFVHPSGDSDFQFVAGSTFTK